MILQGKLLRADGRLRHHDWQATHRRSGNRCVRLHAPVHRQPHPPSAGGAGRRGGRGDLDRRPGQGRDRRAGRADRTSGALHHQLSPATGTAVAIARRGSANHA